VPAGVEEMRVFTIPEGLPLLGSWQDGKGTWWQKYELPSTGIETNVGPARETYRVSIRWRCGSRKYVEVRLEDGLPRPSRQELETEDDQSDDPWHAAGFLAAGAVGQHVDLANELYDRARECDPLGAWQGYAEGVALLRYTTALHRWLEIGAADEPRKALIVRLEEDRPFRRLLADVCNGPRRVLMRQRHLQHIARIQEVDPACIRWAARQPGITVAQKAGRRQQLLGVVRIENADTHENRVVRDLLIRAIRACTQYVRENRRYGSRDRVKRVWRFRRELHRLLVSSAISDVQSLAGIASPNYVLQHDTRYRALWVVYEKLRKHETQQDEVWRWRHRTWAEHSRLGLAAAVAEICPDFPGPAADILVRHEHAAGNFIDARSNLPSACVPDGSRTALLDWVDGRQMGEHVMIPSGIAELCPDLVLLKRMPAANRPLRILCVWSVFDLSVEDDLLDTRVGEISDLLDRKEWPCPLEGLLVQPARSNGGQNATANEPRAKCCRGLRQESDLHAATDRLVELLRQTLNLPKDP